MYYSEVRYGCGHRYIEPISTQQLKEGMKQEWWLLRKFLLGPKSSQRSNRGKYTHGRVELCNACKSQKKDMNETLQEKRLHGSDILNRNEQRGRTRPEPERHKRHGSRQPTREESRSSRRDRHRRTELKSKETEEPSRNPRSRIKRTDVSNQHTRETLASSAVPQVHCQYPEPDFDTWPNEVEKPVSAHGDGHCHNPHYCPEEFNNASSSTSRYPLDPAVRSHDTSNQQTSRYARLNDDEPQPLKRRADTDSGDRSLRDRYKTGSSPCHHEQRRPDRDEFRGRTRPNTRDRSVDSQTPRRRVKQYGPRRSQSAAGTPTTSFYSRSEASPKGNVSGKKHGSASSDPTPKGMPIEDRRFIGQSQVCRSWDEAFHKRRLHGFSPTIETTGEIMGKAEMFVHPRMAPAPPAGIPPFMRPLPGHKLYNDMASKAPRSPFPDIVTDEIKWQHAQLSGKKPHAGTFRSTSKASSKAKSEPAGSIHSAKSARDGRDGSDLAWLSRTSDSAKQSLSQISKDLLDKLRVSRDEDDEESLVCADARRVESGELERGPGQMFPAQTRAE